MTGEPEPSAGSAGSGGSAGSAGDPVERGIEALQTAAQELIDMSRAALDVAEQLVRNPDTAATVASAFASLARTVAKAADTGRRTVHDAGAAPTGRDGDGGGDGRGGGDGGDGVERIPVD
ncbi:MAG: hypothetical protein HYX34_01380 [Actinobacteria bacterium]|nr:hypothetical protein [Actinomycetota bacterium]